MADIASFVFLNAATTLGATLRPSTRTSRGWFERAPARPAVAQEVAEMRAFVQQLFALSPVRVAPALAAAPRRRSRHERVLAARASRPGPSRRRRPSARRPGSGSRRSRAPAPGSCGTARASRPRRERRSCRARRASTPRARCSRTFQNSSGSSRRAVARQRAAVGRDHEVRARPAAHAGLRAIAKVVGQHEQDLGTRRARALLGHHRRRGVELLARRAAARRGSRAPSPGTACSRARGGRRRARARARSARARGRDCAGAAPRSA